MSYSEALPGMLRAVAFCARAYVKFKSSGTVPSYLFKIISTLMQLSLKLPLYPRLKTT